MARVSLLWLACLTACGRTPIDAWEPRLEPCEASDRAGSTTGCSFTVHRHLHLSENVPDGLAVGNDGDVPTLVQRLWVPEGERDPQRTGETVELGPGMTHVFELDDEFLPGSSTAFRAGGAHVVVSEHPVSAHLFAPLIMDRGNDSHLVLPDDALGHEYVVASYSPHEEQDDATFGRQGEPSFFEIVALEDDTTVEWTAPRSPWLVGTAGDAGRIPEVEPGATGTIVLDRFEVVRIAASSREPNADRRDVSGTVVSASRPIRLVGGTRCARVPVREDPERGHCDPISDQLLPLEHWGREYVLAHPPLRTSERHAWRIYAGADGTTLATSTSPTPVELARRGDWIEVEAPHDTSFVVTGDEPFMPVLYLQSRMWTGEDPSTGTLLGDPSMAQAVPTERFAASYVLTTPRGFPLNHVQLIRRNGEPITLDGEVVEGFEAVGEYEVVDFEIPEGTHRLRSAAPFGAMQLGWSLGVDEACPLSTNQVKCFSSYAHAVGLGRASR